MQYRLNTQQKQDVCLKYKGGKNSNQLSQEYGISNVAILGILKRRGVVVRPQTLAQVKHKLWHQAFDKLTPNALYWIGFIFADGTVIRRSGSPEIALVLSETDIKHIEKFKRFLKAEHKLIKVENKGKCFAGNHRYRFCVRSENLAARLEVVGLKPFLASEAIAELTNSNDFWRGVIDGDGCIGISTRNGKPEPRIELVGGYQLLSQFVEYVHSIIPSSKWNVCQHKSIYKVGTSGKNALQLIDVLYSSCSTALTRKRNAAINILRLGQMAEMSSSEKISHKDVTYRNTESVSLESPPITVSV